VVHARRPGPGAPINGAADADYLPGQVPARQQLALPPSTGVSTRFIRSTSPAPLVTSTELHSQCSNAR
jgi:hypothetical protein